MSALVARIGLAAVVVWAVVLFVARWVAAGREVEEAIDRDRDRSREVAP